MKENEKILKILKELDDFLENSEIDDSVIKKFSYYLSKLNKKYEDKVYLNYIRQEYDEKETEQRKKTFNGLTAKEWASLSRNVWNDISSPRKDVHLKHGATYPKLLSDRLIKMYSKEGDLIFDPFLGTGTTLISAKSLNRRGIGIELNKEFYEYAKKHLEESSNLFDFSSEIKIYNDDCRNMDKYLEDESVQLTVTSPPYADFIHKSVKDREKTHKKSKIKLENNSVVKPYSDLENDFGNLPYDKFLDEIEKVLELLYKKTKKNGYSAWVVKDYRDTKNKIPYIDFHSDLAKIGEKVGFKYHDLIIWDQNERRKLILLGYPSVFYTNQNCSFIVIFRKS